VASTRPPKQRPSLVRRIFRPFVRLVKAAIFAFLVAAAWSAGFVALKCYSSSATDRPVESVERSTADLAGYKREEASTYLTLPEWYIVYNTDEYAKALKTTGPASFPYAGSIRQYWGYYGAACAATKGVYPFSTGNHLMLGVIGSSFSIEYALKGLYENTAGRLSEWIAGRDTPEDAFAAATAAEYGTFMHTVPWYEFPFAAKAGALWAGVPWRGPGMTRKWERRLALTAEYGIKAGYAWLIGLGSQATYGPEDLRIQARVENAPESIYADGAVKRVKPLGNGAAIVSIPRYEAFTGRMLALLGQGVRFVDIAGNDEILVTALVTPAWTARELEASMVLDQPLLTDRSTRRVGLKLRVRALHIVIPQVQQRGGRIEHFYDY
jgi:hypothetical protein